MVNADAGWRRPSPGAAERARPVSWVSRTRLLGPLASGSLDGIGTSGDPGIFQTLMSLTDEPDPASRSSHRDPLPGIRRRARVTTGVPAEGPRMTARKQPS
jgi:hypothetical protein